MLYKIYKFVAINSHHNFILEHSMKCIKIFQNTVQYSDANLNIYEKMNMHMVQNCMTGIQIIKFKI